jgi:hypothetical protein
MRCLNQRFNRALGRGTAGLWALCAVARGGEGRFGLCRRGSSDEPRYSHVRREYDDGVDMANSLLHNRSVWLIMRNG